jgi:UDP-N-acetylmuramoyl-tripeptide--D-alanyl-D-alanine ligase
MITLAEAQEATEGRWLRCPLPPGTPIRSGAIDTRALGNAELFAALPGERADGHDFLAALPGTSVRLALVSRDVEIAGFGGAILRVADARSALGRIARYLIDKHRPLVVAITASYGKTTAKELIAHVLEGGRRVLKTPGSFNNEIGVPLTLLALDGLQEAVVLEFAARHPGDIATLGRIAPPDIAVLLNVGRAHIGVFGSLENTYRAKAEIFAALRPGGLAIVGAEDPRLRELARPFAPGRRTVTVGRDLGDFHAEHIQTDAQGRLRFQAVHGEERLELRAGIPGPHAVYPLLAAWAVAREAGLPDRLVAGRADFQPELKGRARFRRAPGGAAVIDDTYNASPETVINLIRTLASLDAPRKLLVLGHLSELEDGLDESLRLIAPHIQGPLSELWVHDPAGPDMARRLREAGAGIPVRDWPDLRGLIAALREHDRPDTAIGFKASRSAHLERAVEGMMGTPVACALATCGLLKHCTDCEKLRPG